MQLDVLLGEHEHDAIEVTDAGRWWNLCYHQAVGGQHLLLDTHAVLSGELQFPQRVTKTRADADGIQQRVLRGPGSLARFPGYADETVIKRHRDGRVVAQPGPDSAAAPRPAG